jgi:class 3 adenylate cyclase/predicted ATPase
MDVSRWLRDLGLQDYAQDFRANDIDAEVLSRLTAEDLIALGVTSVGHRRKLLDAIALLQDGSAPAAAEPALTAAPRVAEAERRQLTVLFCDLVGSTELAARLDPEDLRGIMGAYQRCAAAVVERFEGHVAKYLGDGVLAYFGWPRAHEDDAERAVRAGLTVVEDVNSLAALPGTQLQARVGIATGIAVIGDLIGEGAAREEAVVGDVPNLAARLQALAESGSVVISEATRRLVGGLFELEDLGPQRLKGFAEPLAAFRVAGEGRAEGRFEARQTAGLTPLVGREEEIALLLRRWRQARDGDGQVVLLSGEPGIGKSRLVRELRARLEGEPHVRLLYQCSPHHATSPLHPVIAQLERAAGFARDDSPAAKLAKLDTLLAHGTDRLDQAVPLIAALLGLPSGERYPLPELTPERQKLRTLEVLVEQLAGLAADRPVLVIYEDVHWIDPTTQELLGLAIERIRRLPVLALVTFRPEFTPPWSGPDVSALALTRLGRRDGGAMVERVAGAKALPDEVSAQIVAKTDGVPLFVEELTKTVLESGLLRDAGDHYELLGPLPPLALPATLHDSLLARLDRLAPAKELAQIGAAIGREFSHALLAAVADRPEPELQAALDELVSSELVFRRGVPPEATYSFKHALVQDTAYGTLLKSRRQQLHARIAKAIEERFPEKAEAEPELLAHHSAQAGLAEKSAKHWQTAGQNAVRRFAMTEAVAHLTAALQLLTGSADGQERARRELQLQLMLGGALLATKGWASAEMYKAYARASELCRQLGDSSQLFPALWGLFMFHNNSADIRAGYEVAQELLKLTESQEDSAFRVLAHRCAGVSLLFQGKFERARTHFCRLISHYDLAKHGLPMLVPHDARVAGRNFLSWIRLIEGHPDEALHQSRTALAEARDHAHPFTVAFALHVNCVFNQVLRQRAIVEERSAQLMALAAEQRFPHLLGTGTFFHGWALARRGEVQLGLEEMNRGLNLKRSTGADIKVPYYLSVLGTAYARAGLPVEALPRLAEASALVDKTEERWFEAEVHRRRADILLRLSKPNRAEGEACLRNAIALAQGQGARLWELRAAISLARLWRDQGRGAQAYDLLAPVYGWFTEGFDTADLKDAKELLDQLA